MRVKFRRMLGHSYLPQRQDREARGFHISSRYQIAFKKMCVILFLFWIFCHMILHESACSDVDINILRRETVFIQKLVSD